MAKELKLVKLIASCFHTSLKSTFSNLDNFTNKP